MIETIRTEHEVAANEQLIRARRAGWAHIEACSKCKGPWLDAVQDSRAYCDTGWSLRVKITAAYNRVFPNG